MSTKDFNLFSRARACLDCRDPEQKLALAHSLEADWLRGALSRDSVELEPLEIAGHPERPELVHPRQLRPRSLGSEEGRLAMIHAVTHIEFNAINLACDALFRFREMPAAYYGDWIQVAREEAEHFALLRARLREAGRDYGDYPAHTGLWDMARKTAHDPLVRMALIPRMMEARGLDVTPGIMRRFAAVGDRRTVAALEVILREEVGHVEMGSRWFHHLCRERGLEPEATYFALLQQYLDGTIRCPLNREARRAARFSEGELEQLQTMCRG
ncbi:MAG: ferritin-like domain-containing protein [Candidatus Sedimenticola endophacoides]